MQPTRATCATLLTALVVMTCWAGIFFGTAHTPQKYDQDKAHWPVILQMADSMPAVDLVHYNAATGPLYHLIFAAIVRTTGASLRTAQVINTLFAAAVVYVAFRFAASRTTPLFATSVIFPLAASRYVVSSGIWISTDNFALATALLTLGLAAFGPVRFSTAFGQAASSTVSILARQNGVWLAAPSAFSSLRESALSPGKRIASAMVCAGIPLACAAGLFMLWGGTTPPRFTNVHQPGVYLTVLPFILGIVGVYGVFFLPLTLERLSPSRSELLAGLGGAILAIIPPTNFNYDLGRTGGILWEVIDAAPVVRERSLILIPFAALGAATLTSIAIRAYRSSPRETSVLLVGFAFWAAAQTVNRVVFQRYYEPFVLVLLAWLTVLAGAQPGKFLQRSSPIVLGVLLLITSVILNF